MLCTIEYHNTLFSLNFHRSNSKKTIEKSIKHRCYLVLTGRRKVSFEMDQSLLSWGHVDAKGDQVGRTNIYMRAAKKNQAKIFFHSSCPSRESSFVISLLKKG